MDEKKDLSIAFSLQHQDSDASKITPDASYVNYESQQATPQQHAADTSQPASFSQQSTANPQQFVYYSNAPGASYKPPLREPASKRDLIYAAIFFVLSIFSVNFFLYGGCGAALGISATALFVTGVLYVFPNRKKCSLYACAGMLFYILCATSLIFSDSAVGRFLVICAMLVLSTLTLMELMSLRKHLPGRVHAVLDWFRNALVLPFESINAVFYAIFHRKTAEGETKKRRTGSVLLGLLCAVPVLLIVVPLLISADAAFDQLLSKLTMEGNPEPTVSLLVGAAVFILLFGQHFAAVRKEPEAVAAESSGKGIETTALVSFLSVICVVYVLYLVSQLAYFFNAFRGLLPENYSVAQYARRGFFEMVFICLINLGLVMVALLTARKQNGKEPLIIRIVSLFLCMFSLLLIATAISKMVLYIGSFGLTHLRVLTTVFMVFLCVVFVSVALWIFLRRLPYMKITVITAAVLIALVGFADPDRMVAEYNVNAYLSGELDSIDMRELMNLSSDAVVPCVWELTEDANPRVYEKAWGILYDHLEDYGMVEAYTGKVEEGQYDWRGFNLPSYRAYLFLKEHAEEICSTARKYGYR